MAGLNPDTIVSGLQSLKGVPGWFESVDEGQPFAVVDCFCVLDDEKIRRYLELGCEVKGMGRGHIKRIKDSLNLQPSRGKAKAKTGR